MDLSQEDSASIVIVLLSLLAFGSDDAAYYFSLTKQPSRLVEIYRLDVKRISNIEQRIHIFIRTLFVFSYSCLLVGTSHFVRLLLPGGTESVVNDRPVKSRPYTTGRNTVPMKRVFDRSYTIDLECLRPFTTEWRSFTTQYGHRNVGPRLMEKTISLGKNHFTLMKLLGENYLS